MRTRAQEGGARGGIGEGGGGARKRNKALDKYRGEVGNEGELGCRSGKRRRESVGSVGADRGYLENYKEADGEGQDAAGLLRNCRVCPLSRV